MDKRTLLDPDKEKRFFFSFFFTFALLVFACPALGDTIRLRNGNIIEGTIIEQTDSHILLEHPDLGRIEIPAENIVSINEPGLEYPTPIKSEELPDAPDKDKKEDEESKEDEKSKSEWNFSLTLGGIFTNNDEGEKWSINGRFRADRKLPHREASLVLSGLYKMDNNEVDKNNYTAIYTNRWLLPKKPWSYFIRLRYDYDQFRSWTQRLQGHAAIAYSLADKEHFQLRPYAGIGFRKDINSEEEAFPVEGVLGVSLDWKPSKSQELLLDIAYYPVLGKPDYRYVIMLDWKHLILEKARLSFNVNLEYEYATDPDEGFPPNNYKVTWGLQWDL